MRSVDRGIVPIRSRSVPFRSISWNPARILFLFVATLFPAAAHAAHYTDTVSTYSELTTSITAYKNGYPGLYQSGEIVIDASFSVPATGIHLADIENLTLRGETTGTDRLTASKHRLTATTNHASYSSVITVGGNAKGITVEDLEIVVSRGVANKSTRGVSVVSPSGQSNESLLTQDVLLRNLVILPPSGSTIDTVGIQVSNARRVAVNHCDISGLDGIALLMRRVKHLEISHNKIHDLLLNTPGIIVDGVGAPVPPATAGTETTQYSAFFESEYGNIFRNELKNVPGQGIFVEGNYFLIDENRLDRVALGPVGGRGIYVKGQDFRIAGNYLTKIDNNGAGGGINAGSDCTSRVFIEGNRIERAGRTTSGGSSTWNGFGVSIREDIILENNEIVDSGSNGILIQPNSSNILINENTIERSAHSNIRVSAGYTYDGRYLHREPFGPAKDIIIRDNRIYSASDYGIEVVPRKRNDMLNASIDTVLSGWVANCGYVWQDDGQASFCGTSEYVPYSMWPSNGYLIQPNSSNILINENTIERSAHSNIRVSAGYTYDGRYLHREPFGPAKDIIIRDNRIYSASDYGIEVVPRKRNDMLNASIDTVLSGWVANCGYVWQDDGQASFCGTSEYVPYSMWPSNGYWNVYEVTMINNSLWYNQDGGIEIENPGATNWPSTGSGGGCSEFPYNWDNPSYYIHYATSAYNGQGSGYCNVPKVSGASPTAIPGGQVVDCTDVDGLRGDLAALSFWSTTQFGSSVADHPEYYPDLANPRQISRVLPWLSCSGSGSYPTSKCP